MLQGFIVLLAFQLVGEAIRQLIQSPIPGPVIGMVLLWAALHLKGGPSQALMDTSQGIIKHLSLLFLPAGVGLFFLPPEILNDWPAILGAMFGATFISMMLCGGLIKWLGRKES